MLRLIALFIPLIASAMAFPAMAASTSDDITKNFSSRISDVRACAVQPDSDCIANIAFSLEIGDSNSANRALVAERLAIAGQFDLAQTLTDLVNDENQRQRIRRIIAQRHIAVTAVIRPGMVADLADLDAFDREEGPLAVTDKSSGNSPYMEIVLDVRGFHPYGPVVPFRDDTVPRSKPFPPGEATLRALLPRWNIYADELAGPKRAYELRVLASVERSLNDETGAVHTLEEAEHSATGGTYAIIADGWLQFGRTDKAMAVVLKLPEANPPLFLRLANAMLGNGTPPATVMPLVRDALPAIYRSAPNVDFAMVRRAVQIAARAGLTDEAKGMIRDGAAFARANAGIKWNALTAMAASSIDIGDQDTAHALLLESSHLSIPDIFRASAFADLAAQFYRLGDETAFQAARDAMPEAQRWEVWSNVLRENAIPGDPLSFAREISSGLPSGQQLIQYSIVGRKLIADGRTEEGLNLLRLGLDIAELAPADTKSSVYDFIITVALNVGAKLLAERALRDSISVVMTGPDPALYLSYILAVWHDQFDNLHFRNK